MMEELMASRFQTFFQGKKKASATPGEVIHSLYPVCTAQQLFEQSERKKILRNIRFAINEPGEHFNNLYQNLLNNFSEFTQLLPHPALKAYQYDGGILNYALERTLVAIQIRKDYVPIDDTQPTATAEHERLWTYALFSGTLLHQVSMQVCYYRVHLFDASKNFTQQWQPYTQSMLGLGQFYKYWFVSTTDARQYRTTTTLLAKQLMPVEGFSWIASNPKIFAMWLAFLNGDDGESGMLQTICEHVDETLLLSEESKEALEQEEAPLDEEDAEEEDKKAQEAFEKALEEAEQLNALKDTSAGEAFLNWLIKGLKDKSIRVNERQSLVHILKEGVFLLHPEIFQHFSQLYSKQFPNWVTVHKQFNMLGFAKLSGQDYRFDQFFAKSPHSPEAVSGLLIQDARGLFAGAKRPGVSQNLQAIAYDLSSVYSQTLGNVPSAVPIKPQSK